MIERLFPRAWDGSFRGHRAGLWILWLLIALKLAMSVNGILNARKVAAGADGIPIDSFGPAAAQAVLTAFALIALGQLALTLVALAAALRYRAMVPFVFLLLLAEHGARRLIVGGGLVPSADRAVPVGFWINMGLLVLLAMGLALSLMNRQPGQGEAA
jgi:hypothetical protein